MPEFDDQAFLSALKAIVDADPEFEYEAKARTLDSGVTVQSCLYVHDGEPDCLIGRALHAVGVPVDDLAAIDRAEEYGDTSAEVVLRGLGAEDSTALFADDVQSQQDYGEPWGDAYAYAVELQECRTRV